MSHSFEKRAAVEMALGRIFRLMSRPEQPGDAEQYEAARRVVVDTLIPIAPDYQPNFARDYHGIVMRGGAR